MKTPQRNPSPWPGLIESISSFLQDPLNLRLDRLHWSGDSREQRSAYHLLMWVVRHRSLMEHLILQHAPRRPKPRLQALLSLAIAEMLESDGSEGKLAKIVDHSVRLTRERCSAPESRFVNAVARTISRNLPEVLSSLETPEHWHLRYSHPKWLVDRWRSEFGDDTTRSLLEWNQRIPRTFVHDLHALLPQRSATGEPALHPGLSPTNWTDFWELEKQGRSLLEALLEGPYYIQDPSTRIAPSLFEIGSECDHILDACAAPGGKSLHLMKRLGSAGRSWQRWITADGSAERLKRLTLNFDRLGIHGVEPVHVNWFEPLPEALSRLSFDWVLLDAPCSSVGVIQRHPEIRWRLRPGDFERMPTQQLAMLQRCSERVRPGGQLVYSTCSFDPAENQHVVAAFLESAQGRCFRQCAETVLLPPNVGHDGVGAFHFRRSGDP